MLALITVRSFRKSIAGLYKMVNNVTPTENTTITNMLVVRMLRTPTPQNELVINPFAEHPN